MPVREDIYAEPSSCEVGWPVPFLAAFISPVFPLVTYLLLGEQSAERAFSQGIESGSNRRPSAWEACALTTMLPRSYKPISASFFDLVNDWNELLMEPVYRRIANV